MKPRLLRRTLAALTGAIALAADTAVPRDSTAPEHGLKIIETHPIIFPVQMLREGILHGEARIVFHLDHEGRLVDSLAIAYSAKPFADCVIDALQRWKFVPQRSGDRPDASVVHLTVRFETNGIIAIERSQPPAMDLNAHAPAGTFVYQPCPPASLDRPLRPTTVVPPDYPRELRRQGVSGVVPVNFYVDEQGRPRMVVSTPDAHPTLAALAIAALERWQFEPPTSRGKAVLVNVSQEFRFAATD